MVDVVTSALPGQATAKCAKRGSSLPPHALRGRNRGADGHLRGRDRTAPQAAAANRHPRAEPVELAETPRRTGQFLLTTIRVPERPSRIIAMRHVPFCPPRTQATARTAAGACLRIHACKGNADRRLRPAPPQQECQPTQRQQDAGRCFGNSHVVHRVQEHLTAVGCEVIDPRPL